MVQVNEKNPRTTRLIFGVTKGQLGLPVASRGLMDYNMKEVHGRESAEGKAFVNP
jgi:hypothetical protein